MMAQRFREMMAQRFREMMASPTCDKSVLDQKLVLNCLSGMFFFFVFFFV